MAGRSKEAENMVGKVLNEKRVKSRDRSKLSYRLLVLSFSIFLFIDFVTLHFVNGTPLCVR